MSVEVSVILTSYNKPETVGMSIESVIKQTLQNWELFIMDDNSNKETNQVIQRYLHDPRIHYFNSHINDNERYKTTRYATLINEAIPKTQGKYITYLTDDNLFLPERFELMVNFLVQKPNIDIVYSEQHFKWFDENDNLQNEMIRKTRGILTKAAGLVDHCSIMHTKRIAKLIFDKYGIYWNNDPKYWFNGDIAFWNRLNELQPFYPLNKTLDIALKFSNSFQRLYAYLPNTIPNGRLVRGLLPEVYLIDQQKKRKFTEGMLEKLKYNREQIVQIPDPFLFKYEEGLPINHNALVDSEIFPNQRLVKLKSRPEVYFIQNNKKHHIENEIAFFAFKFKGNEIVEVGEKFLEGIPQGHSITPLSNYNSVLPDGALFQYHSELYISYNNNLHPIQKKVMDKLKFSETDIVKVTKTFLSKYNKGESFTWGYSY